MFWKLVVVILGLGGVGCALLALRQSRFEMASAMARTQIRIQGHDDRLWSLRAEVAARVTPRRVSELLASVEPLRPLAEPARVVPSEEGAAGRSGPGEPSAGEEAEVRPSGRRSPAAGGPRGRTDGEGRR